MSTFDIISFSGNNNDDDFSSDSHSCIINEQCICNNDSFFYHFIENFNFKNNENDNYESINTITNSSHLFLNKKRRKEIEDNENINSEQEKEIVDTKNLNDKEDLKDMKEKKENKINNKPLFKTKEQNKIPFGRKKQEEKNKGVKGNHNRYSEDNIIRKIKSFFGKSIYKYINKSLKDSKILKLEIDINKNLKRDLNIKLFKKTLKEIYLESKISNKYKDEKQGHNIDLIKKIYSENKEIEVIKILNLTYLEAFNIFRRKIMKEQNINENLLKKIEGIDILDNHKFEDITSLLDKIKKEEEKNKNGDINKYLNDVKYLCEKFENWFKDKVGRD